MKSRTFLTTIFAIFLSIATFANNSERIIELSGSKVKIAAIENTKAVTITINNLSLDVLEISLESNDGDLLYSETAKNVTSYAKRLNLTQLQAGTYKLTIKKNLVKTIQPFELTETNVIMTESERKEKFLPNIVQKGHKLDINVMLGNYSNIHVKIYDNEGRLVFEDTNYVVITLNKRFDLNKLSSGIYIVEVNAGDETQYATITL